MGLQVLLEIQIKIWTFPIFNVTFSDFGLGTWDSLYPPVRIRGILGLCFIVMAKSSGNLIMDYLDKLYPEPPQGFYVKKGKFLDNLHKKAIPKRPSLKVDKNKSFKDNLQASKNPDFGKKNLNRPDLKDLEHERGSNLSSPNQDRGASQGGNLDFTNRSTPLEDREDTQSVPQQAGPE